MWLVSLFFALLLLPTPPLIIAGWLILFLRFGLLGDIIKRTSWLIDPQEDSIARGQSWLALAIAVFILSIMLFVSPLVVSLMQESENSQVYTPGERMPSLGTLAFTFFYSPIALILTVEAWLILLNCFGLHYLLYYLKIPTDQVQPIKSISMTTLQLLSILTGLIGFGWWSSLNPFRYDESVDFSVMILSPTTVLLTFGLVIMLFFSLNKILAVEENTEHHQQIAKRMIFILLSALILLGLVGGILSLLIHLNPLRLPSIT